MTTTIRSVLGAAIMAIGSLVVVLVIEGQTFAGDLTCTDNGCASLGGISARDCGYLDSQTPCTSGPGARCSCEEIPYNNSECYCHASVS
jgi:hypothetical protein